jgi:hypothetical protein
MVFPLTVAVKVPAFEVLVPAAQLKAEQEAASGEHVRVLVVLAATVTVVTAPDAEKVTGTVMLAPVQVEFLRDIVAVPAAVSKTQRLVEPDELIVERASVPLQEYAVISHVPFRLVLEPQPEMGTTIKGRIHGSRFKLRFLMA